LTQPADVPLIDADQPDHGVTSGSVGDGAELLTGVHFEWKREKPALCGSRWNGGQGLNRPDVRMAAMEISGPQRKPVFLSANCRYARWIERCPKALWGMAGRGGCPVRKPGLYAGDIFKTLQDQQGIRLRT